MDDATRQLLKDALAELEEREWAYTVDLGEPVVHCRSCTASNRRKEAYGIPPPKEHDQLCTLKSVMDRIRDALG